MQRTPCTNINLFKGKTSTNLARWPSRLLGCWVMVSVIKFLPIAPTFLTLKKPLIVTGKSLVTMTQLTNMLTSLFSPLICLFLSNPPNMYQPEFITDPLPVCDPVVAVWLHSSCTWIHASQIDTSVNHMLPGQPPLTQLYTACVFSACMHIAVFLRTVHTVYASISADLRHTQVFKTPLLRGCVTLWLS